jgi:hypothetical protein
MRKHSFFYLYLSGETMNLSKTRAIVQRIAECRNTFPEDSSTLFTRQEAIYYATIEATQPGSCRKDRENLAYTLENVIPVPLTPEAAGLVEGLKRG